MKELVASATIGDFPCNRLHLEGYSRRLQKLFLDRFPCRPVVAEIQCRHVLQPGNQVIDHWTVRIPVHPVFIKETKLVRKVTVGIFLLAADTGHDPRTLACCSENTPVPRRRVSGSRLDGIDVFRSHAFKGPAPSYGLFFGECPGLFDLHDTARYLLDSKVVTDLTSPLVLLAGYRQFPNTDVHHFLEKTLVSYHPALRNQNAEICCQSGITVFRDTVPVNSVNVVPDTFRRICLDGFLHYV